MSTCRDCTDVKRAAAGDDRFEVIDIGEHVHNLKEFLQLRDNNPKFKLARARGLVGIPCFLLPDGTLTFRPEEAGLDLSVIEKTDGPACNIDGSGC